MTLNPQDARDAVSRVLAEVSREHEAAYAVISKAVRICVTSGMSRRETARYLGIRKHLINRSGQYVRSLRATKDLFGSAFSVSDPKTREAIENIIERVWKR